MTGDETIDGRFDGREHRLRLRVWFEDTDLSGVVYHANYLRYMERARSAMLRLAGIDQRALFEAEGVAYAVANLAIRYHAPAKLDDLLDVASRVVQVTPARAVIHQTVSRGTVKLTTAEVTAALVARSGRPVRQPADWIDRFRRLIAEREPV